jgi:DNA polymerase-1
MDFPSGVKMKKTLMAVDGNSLMHRAFYALPLLSKADGEYTNAVFGFFSMLINAISAQQPDYLAIAFDKKGKTFRHEMFDDYKGTRKPTPPELIPQFDTLKKALKGLNIAVLEQESYEADDILGMLSIMARDNGMEALLLTGDKDSLQLISDSCRVMLTRKGVSEIDLFDTQKLYDTYELLPAQIVDLKGFMGDSSDNIPGVPGVGEKTALSLLHTYGSMDEVYAHIDEVKGKLKDKLIDNKELAYMSHRLATIDSAVPMDISVEELFFAGLAGENAKNVFSELEFFSLLKRIAPQTAVKKEVDSVAVASKSELEHVLAEAEGQAFVAIDFGECLTLAFSDKREYSVVTEHSLLNTDFSFDIILKILKPLLEDIACPKLLHDAKRVSTMLYDYGIALKGVLFDTALAEYVLNPSAAGLALSKLAENYGFGGNAAAIAALYRTQEAKLQEDGLWYVYNNIEIPLTRVLLDMERTGFRIDMDELGAYDAKLSAQIESLTEEIYSLCACGEFNINSTKQLGLVLFKKLGLPSGKKSKTGYSTDIAVLEGLIDKHPVIEKLIEFRRLTKLKSTYLDGLRKIADGDGFVHTTFVQISTVTGRISSKEPNLQNIPVRTQEGREIRRLFLPSLPGRKLISADYSQIELRILASISDDGVMKEAFSSGIDIHTRTASEVFDVPLDKVTSDMRRSAKAVNFGIVYGISDFGLARNLNIPVKKAGGYISRYFARFPGVREYMDGIIEKAKADGYVTTMLGRRRYLPELRSSNYNMRSFGERAALNTPIQGTAADIIKIAMIDVWEKLRDGGYRSKLILQVHDELVIDAPEDEVSTVSALLKECMETAYVIDVPFEAQVAVGDNWLDAK